MPAQWLVCDGYAAGDSDQSRLTLSRGMSLLVSGDVIRPNPGWLLTPATPSGLVTDLARTRDPDGFATLANLCRSSGVNSHTTQLALRRIATIVAAKGGRIIDINIGDCLELLRIAEDLQASPAASSPYFYQLLRTAEVFGGRAPAVRALKTAGQLSCEQLIDRYAITCGPVRDLLVDYLRERQPGVDYATLHKLSYTLGRLFWRDLEIHHPGIGSLRLEAADQHQDPPSQGQRRAPYRGNGTADQRDRTLDHGARFLPRHRPVGRRGTCPLGSVGGALPDPGFGSLTQQTLRPQVPHGSTHP